MGKFDLLYKSALELKSLINNKEISCLELTNLALERITDTNSKTNAFITVTEELAINSAKNVDKKIQTKQPIGLLGGVPTSIKDLEPVKGYRTTKGSLFLENSVSKIDQLGVERIKNEDGIILGKTNVPEFGASGGTENVTLTAAQSGLKAHTVTVPAMTTNSQSATTTGNQNANHHHNTNASHETQDLHASGDGPADILWPPGTGYNTGNQSANHGHDYTHTHTTPSTPISISGVDASNSHTNLQPYICVNYIIKL